MSNVPTPHISAKVGDFAKTVLMPGDPLRAKFIAENYLNNPILINEVRGILGYTGDYEGVKVSVMASGMGMPSMGIYSYELFNFYDVENIIRIGSAGAISEDVQLRDVVVGMSACTNSNFSRQYELPGTYSPTASYKLLKAAETAASEMNIKLKIGTILSSDTFYDDSSSLILWQKMGVLAVEMEAAALYMNAARAGKNALAICTISDCPFSGQSSSSEEREKSFTQMMEIALKTAAEL